MSVSSTKDGVPVVDSMVTGRIKWADPPEPGASSSALGWFPEIAHLSDAMVLLIKEYEAADSLVERARISGLITQLYGNE